MTHDRDDTPVSGGFDLRLARRLLGILAPHKWWTLASLGVVLAGIVPSLVQPYLYKVAIDQHILPGRVEGLQWIALAYLASLLVESALLYGEVLMLEQTGQRLIHDLRLRLFGHLRKLSSSFYDRNPVGRIVTRVTSDVESINELFSSGLISTLADVLKVAAIVAILWNMDARLTLLSFAILLPLGALSALFSRALRRVYRALRAQVARINVHLQESLSGVRLLQIFRAEPQNRRQFEAISREHMEVEKRSALLEGALSALVELVGTTAVALLLWSGGIGIVAGSVSLGTLVAFLQYVQRFFGPLRELSGRYAVMQAALASAEKIFGLLDTPPEIVAPPAPVRPERARGEIEFRDVWFAYAGGEPVLRGLNLRIEPGERVALAGATGAGKTTLVKLLTRLYDPQRGSIRLDGVDLRDMDPREVRRRIGLVLQDGTLFAETLGWNLRLGSDDFDEDRMWEALRQTRAEDWVRALPLGLEEPVRERGANFSAGQRQILSLARALLFDPPVLIFDEATSAIDPATDAEIRASVREAARGRTLILIAHRPASLDLADRVIAIDGGTSHQAAFSIVPQHSSDPPLRSPLKQPKQEAAGCCSDETT